MEQRLDGNRTYYRCNQQSPLVGDLQNLLVKTVGVIGLLKHSLKAFSKQIEVAFIFGSFAQSRELATSDVDVMIIGSLGLAQVSPVLAKLEARIGRPINPVILSSAETRKKLETNHPFLDSVRKANKVFLQGEDSELGKAFSRQEAQDS